jgi:hypothetical protein
MRDALVIDPAIGPAGACVGSKGGNEGDSEDEE